MNERDKKFLLDTLQEMEKFNKDCERAGAETPSWARQVTFGQGMVSGFSQAIRYMQRRLAAEYGIPDPLSTAPAEALPF